MKTIRLFYIILLALVIAGLVYEPVFASPRVYPVPAGCSATNSREIYLLMKIDIPAHRAEYAVLDRFSLCEVDFGPIMLVRGWKPAT